MKLIDFIDTFKRETRFRIRFLTQEEFDKPMNTSLIFSGHNDHGEYIDYFEFCVNSCYYKGYDKLITYLTPRILKSIVYTSEVIDDCVCIILIDKKIKIYD